MGGEDFAVGGYFGGVYPGGEGLGGAGSEVGKGGGGEAYGFFGGGGVGGEEEGGNTGRL